jgi:glycosyltransferase involved in cell wall biosynthesis
VFLFVGAGPRLEEVRRACADLPNVRFLPYQPRASLDALCNAADVHLVTLRDEVSGLLVPSKTAAALACGKPVLLVGGEGSALAAEIRRAGAGWCCSHDADEVAAVVASVARGEVSAAEAGSRARELFETGYDRRVATGRWRALLEEICGAGPRETARA